MSYQDLKARFAPIGAWPGERTVAKRTAAFRAGWEDTLKILARELAYLDATNLVVRVDLEPGMIRQDGYPRGDARANGPGVILEFDSKFGFLTYPCDTYWSWQHNIRAIALSLEALRACDRHGVSGRGQQYSGWKKLGSGLATVQRAMTPAEGAAFVMKIVGFEGFESGALLTSADAYRLLYREAVKAAHPDAGGKVEDFQRLQEAKRVLDQHHGIQ